MELKCETKADNFIIHITEDVDLFSAPNLKKAFQELETNPAKNCIVNLTGVQYLDSTALGALIFGANTTKKKGGKFSCVGVREELKYLIKTVSLTELLGVTDDTAAIGLEG